MSPSVVGFDAGLAVLVAPCIGAPWRCRAGTRGGRPRVEVVRCFSFGARGAKTIGGFGTIVITLPGSGIDGPAREAAGAAAACRFRSNRLGKVECWSLVELKAPVMSALAAVMCLVLDAGRPPSSSTTEQSTLSITATDIDCNPGLAVEDRLGGHTSGSGAAWPPSPCSSSSSSSSGRAQPWSMAASTRFSSSIR